jgi:hypothetical protein
VGGLGVKRKVRDREKEWAGFNDERYAELYGRIQTLMATRIVKKAGEWVGGSGLGTAERW